MSRKPLASPTNSRQSRTKIVVVGEGKTERDYIERLRQLDVFPRINFKFVEGKMDKFQTVKQENLGVEVQLLVDIDNCVRHDVHYQEIHRMLTHPSTKHITFYNNYSFETWLLNHSCDFHKPMTQSRQYNPWMKASFGVDAWSSNKTDHNRDHVMKQITASSVEKAAERVRSMHHSIDSNPTSNMDQWVQRLKSK